MTRAIYLPYTASRVASMTKPRSVGRPRSEFPERYQVRHTAEQMQAWTAAAERDGRTLQSWIRWTLDRAAKKSK